MLARLMLVAAVLFCLAGSAQADPPPDPIHVTGPYTSGNLTVYLVHGPNLLGEKKYLTLTDGLESKKVIVHEKRQVNELSVENQSDDDLFLQAGQIVKGGQQDRTLGRDMIVPAHSGEVAIGANCVEHGRWTQRGGESREQFDSSTNMLASKELKAANYAHDQTKVWNGVAAAQTKLASNAPALAGGRQIGPTTSPTSLELTVEDKAVAEAAGTYEKKMVKDTEADLDAIGFVFAINGKLNSGDIYASPALFAKMYPQLLHAAAIEAIAERDPATDIATYQTLKTEAIEAMLKAVDESKTYVSPANASTMERDINAQARMPQPAGAGTEKSRTVLLTRETDKMILYETRDTQIKAAFVHRAYFTK